MCSKLYQFSAMHSRRHFPHSKRMRWSILGVAQAQAQTSMIQSFKWSTYWIFSAYTKLFTYPQRKMSNGLKSGDLAGVQLVHLAQSSVQEYCNEVVHHPVGKSWGILLFILSKGGKMVSCNKFKYNNKLNNNKTLKALSMALYINMLLKGEVQYKFYGKLNVQC